MKISELQLGDSLWIYNSYKQYFAEFEFIQNNGDGTSRFHMTGNVSIYEPDAGYTIDSIEFRIFDCKDDVKVKIIKTKGLSYKLLKIKEYFKFLIEDISEAY